MIDWAKNNKMHHSIFETAGQTPLVALHKVSEKENTIAGKLEFFNPSGSLKDRILYRMVEAAETRGELRPGMSIIEGTTGNTGIATAMVGAVKEYPVVIVMPDGMSDERKKTILAYGAELVLTKGAESDVDIVIDKVREIKAAHPGRFWEVAQFDNHDNAIAHYLTTGPEIWEQTEGKIDAFVASQGTGGTVSGVARYLKEKNPAIKVYAVEPAECPILSGGDWGSHRIEGIGDGFIPQVLDVSILDGVIQTSPPMNLFRDGQRTSAQRREYSVGFHLGAMSWPALKLIQKHPDIETRGDHD
jgi:cysteine synthase